MIIAPMLVDRKTYQRKIEICESCEKYNAKLRQCNVCKCIMTLKARLKGNTCPIGKHDVDEQSFFNK
jgi:hypothetical protein